MKTSLVILIISIIQLSNLSCSQAQITLPLPEFFSAPLQVVGNSNSNGNVAFQADSEPIVIENQGVDANGNPFMEKQIMQTSFGGYMDSNGEQSFPDLISSIVASNELNNVNRLNTLKRKRMENLRRMEQLRFLNLFNLDDSPLNSQHISFLNNDYSPDMNVNEEILPATSESQINSVLSSGFFDWIKPDMKSKQMFELIMIPDDKLSNMNYDNQEGAYDLNGLKNALEQSENKFLNNLRSNDEDYFEKSQEKVETIAIPQISESNVDEKAKTVDNKIKSYDLVDGSYVFIEFNKLINRQDVKNLTKLIQSVPSSWLKNFKISDNVVFFKLNNGEKSQLLIKELGEKHNEINRQTGLKIVASGLGKKEHYVEIIKQKLIDSNSENFFLVTIILCVTVACVLFSLLIVFLVRRRNQLRSKLTTDIIGGGGKAKRFNDEEHLIANESSSWTSSLKNAWPFGKSESTMNTTNENTTPSKNYQDLCRSRMQGKSTPKNSDNASILSNESTPSVVPSKGGNGNGSDQKVDSSRSSTSS